MFLDKSDKIYVAGHSGLAGSAIVRELERQGYTNIIVRTHQELDLENRDKTFQYICDEKPRVVFLAAGKVGGIYANNSYPVDFLMKNLTIQSNVVQASHRASIERLIFLGSSCIYPKNCPIPIKEEYLLTSELEPTNRPYALAKIAGIEMCWSYNRQFKTQYLAAMPTNLYGPNDNYDLENCHVLPALIRKIHEAKIKKFPFVEIWGTGKPRREFLHSDDLACALVHLMNLSEKDYQSLVNNEICPLINVGASEDISIADLMMLLKKLIGYEGDFIFDKNKPDGTYQKLLSTEKMHLLNWQPKIKIKKGLSLVYQDFLSRYCNV